MTEPPAAPLPTYEPEAAAPEPKKRRRIPIIGLVLAVLTAAAIGYVAWREFSGDDKYPDKWDPKVLPFVKIVEEERGLKFKHPVYVDFLSDKEFAKKSTTDESDLDAEDKASLKESQAIFVATGLLSPKVDLLKETNALSSGGVIGSYSYKSERITMRGEKLNAKSKSTLVHELTHVLQDQHFDLERFRGDEDEGQRGGLRTIAEGDADRIEEKYTDDLSKSEKEEIDRIEDKQSKNFEKSAGKVPEVLTILFGTPYVLGGRTVSLAKAVDDDGENAAIDRLLEDPPGSEEDLLDPYTFLVDKDKDIQVKVPTLDKQLEKHLGDGTFGAMGWLLVLSQRLSAEEALVAVDGWGGDQYVAFERANQSCLRVDYRGDTKDDVNQMYDALTRWREVAPGAASTLERQGAGLRFATCQPPTKATVGESKFRDAIGLELVRTDAAQAFIEEGAPPEAGRCSGEGIVREFDFAEINTPTPTEAAREQLMALARGCAS